EAPDRSQEARTDREERHQADGLFAEPPSEDAVHERAEERHRENDRDEREVVRGEEVHRQFLRRSASSERTVRRTRKSERTIARPTATSAASAAMMKNAKTWPV